MTSSRPYKRQRSIDNLMSKKRKIQSLIQQIEATPPQADESIHTLLAKLNENEYERYELLSEMIREESESKSDHHHNPGFVDYLKDELENWNPSNNNHNKYINGTKYMKFQKRTTASPEGGGRIPLQHQQTQLFPQRAIHDPATIIYPYHRLPVVSTHPGINYNMVQSILPEHRGRAREILMSEMPNLEGELRPARQRRHH